MDNPLHRFYPLFMKSYDYLLLAVLWIGWCSLHSYLISRVITDFFRSLMGAHFSYYRMLYNLFALATLLPLVIYSHSLKHLDQQLFSWSGIAILVRLLLLGVAGFLFVSGAKAYDMSQFLGITQIKTGESPRALAGDNQPNDEGILSWIRHPWYTGGIVLVWSGLGEYYLSTVMVAVILSCYFVVGAALEEVKLVAVYGKSYEEYKKRVGMFIPKVFFSSKY